MAEARVDDSTIHLICDCGEEILIPLPLKLEATAKEGSDVVHLKFIIGDIDMAPAQIHQFEKHMGLGDLDWELSNDS